MSLSQARLEDILRGALIPDEVRKSLVYLCTVPVAAGDRLKDPKGEVVVPWNALLAFVDREPLANWGHSARYILVNRENGEINSVEARVPPFHSGDGRPWRVFYQAPGVPDTALAVPK